MAWNIPELPSFPAIKPLRYLLWAIGLIWLLIASLLLTIFLYQDNDQSLFWLLAIYLPFTLWLLLFSCRYIYHCSQLIDHLDKKTAYRQLTQTWQAWSKAQLAIFGYHIVCAEPDGLAALTGDKERVPLYPLKARPLYHASAATEPYWFLDDVMKNLAQQSANYRKYLTHIYLPNELMDDDDLLDAIFERWDLKPEAIDDYEAFMAKIFKNPKEVELSLLLVCQYDDSAYHQHSKFISAMLLGNEALIDKTGLLAKAWLGRLMLSEVTDLSADIEQLFNYNQLPPDNIKEIWISGLNDQTRLALTITSHDLKVGGQHGVTFHDIDLTFAKPSKLTRYFVLAIASSRADQLFREQLTVNGFQGQIYMQLISSKKFVSQ